MINTIHTPISILPSRSSFSTVHAVDEVTSRDFSLSKWKSRSRSSRSPLLSRHPRAWLESEHDLRVCVLYFFSSISFARSWRSRPLTKHVGLLASAVVHFHKLVRSKTITTSPHPSHPYPLQYPLSARQPSSLIRPIRPNRPPRAPLPPASPFPWLPSPSLPSSA